MSIILYILCLLGLSQECVQMLYDFVKEKSAQLVKWKGREKTTKYKHEKEIKAKVIFLFFDDLFTCDLIQYRLL